MAVGTTALPLRFAAWLVGPEGQTRRSDGHEQIDEDWMGVPHGGHHTGTLAGLRFNGRRIDSTRSMGRGVTRLALRDAHVSSSRRHGAPTSIVIGEPCRITSYKPLDLKRVEAAARAELVASPTFPSHD